MTQSKPSSSSSSSFEVHSSFADLVDRYDGFILDQFGVMHNGTHGLEGAPECVKELHSKGKKLIILSNSSSSTKACLAKLPKLGFDPTHLAGAVTSGEEASHYIAKHYQHKKALWITWKTPKSPSPLDFLSQCGNVDITDTVEDADFILVHGAEVLRGPGDDGTAQETSLGSFPTTGDMKDVIDPLLQQCQERNIPMVCANPDFIMVKPDGSKGHMPGKISRRYEELGGTCVSFGKPHVPHFEACVRELNLPKDKVVHVGDSLHHDVAGANGTGIASAFVVGGVHREELGCELGTVPTKDALETLFSKYQEVPTHVVPMLKM